MNRGIIFKIVLGVVLIGNTADARPLFMVGQPLHIDANVRADVFADGGFVGKTPLMLPGNEYRDIVLKKPGYRNAAVVPNAAEEKRILSTTFGDPPRDEFLLADERFGAGLWCHVPSSSSTPFDFTSYNNCIITGSTTFYPTAFALVVPSEVTRFALPYRATYYAPQQVYVYMMRENGQSDNDDWMLRRYVVNNFGEFVGWHRGLFLWTVSKMAGLPAHEVVDIIAAHPEPVAAANAIAEQARRKR